jgi:hypothetical protein
VGFIGVSLADESWSASASAQDAEREREGKLEEGLLPVGLLKSEPVKMA